MPILKKNGLTPSYEEVINPYAHCKTQFYTINSSESFKDYSLEIFSQACQLTFTVCAAAQINARRQMVRPQQESQSDRFLIFSQVQFRRPYSGCLSFSGLITLP